MKFTLFLIFALLITTIGCQKKEEIVFNKLFISSIAKEDTNYPSRYSSTLFFGTCKNRQVVLLTIYDLREIYNFQFKSKSYIDFLTDLFEQKLFLDCSDKSKILVIDKTIESDYKKLGFEKFKFLYCYEAGNKHFLRKDVKNKDAISIIYFLFRYNYISNYDDYSGAFVITKL